MGQHILTNYKKQTKTNIMTAMTELKVVKVDRRDVDSVNINIYYKNENIGIGHINEDTSYAHISLTEGKEDLESCILEEIEKEGFCFD